MKRIKLLTPILGLTAMVGAITPLASCSCGTTEEGAKANLTVTSTDNVKIKESNVELNKDSTVTLSVPNMKAIKTIYIHVGTVVLKEDRDFTVDYNENVINIKGSVLNNKDVEITVFTTKQNGIKAEVKDSKSFEALTEIKASDIVVTPTYEETTKSSKPLTYGSDYIVYDKSASKEVENFDTVGYTVTRPDGKVGYKEFIIEYVPFNRYTCELKVNTEPRLEPETIESVDYCDYLTFGDKITTDSLIINANMAKPAGSTKILEWGKDYKIYDGDTEITDFGENGYTFNKEGDVTLRIECIENPTIPQDIVFHVQPEAFKNTLAITNIGGEGTIQWTASAESANIPSIEYNCNDGKGWQTFAKPTGSASTIDIGKNTSIYLRGINDSFNTKDLTNTILFLSKDSTDPSNIKLSGSVLDLLNYKNPESITQLPDYCFQNMFAISYDKTDTATISSVSSNFLGNAKLSPYCYDDMFSYNVKLVNAPALPATELADHCYSYMFLNCTNLVKAPALPAKELKDNCYICLFGACTSLISAPELPATELTKDCYSHMFYNCRNLINAPELPAENLEENCYYGMFNGCVNLKEAPELKAQVMKSNCYTEMFSNCIAITKAPELPAKELAEYCYARMFSNCSNLTITPSLPATKLAKGCYKGMFASCTSLESAPTLSSINLAGNCYEAMFQNCTSLTSAPELPAETLATYCYSYMFYGCTKLEEPPKLPAMQLATSCYWCMFESSGLKSAPELPAETLIEHCYCMMFSSCSNLTKAPNLPAKVLKRQCYQMMFDKCKNLEINNDGSGTSTQFFTCPTDIAYLSVTNMFRGTKGHESEDYPVEAGKSYYWVEQ